MKRPSGEKHCEKVEPIAGIAFHPQSTSDMPPEGAKRADRLSDKNTQAWTESG